jgi:hypothetical protein
LKKTSSWETNANTSQSLALRFVDGHHPSQFQGELTARKAHRHISCQTQDMATKREGCGYALVCPELCRLIRGMSTGCPAIGPLAAVTATECWNSPVTMPRVPFISPVLRFRFRMQINPKEVPKEKRTY